MLCVVKPPHVADERLDDRNSVQLCRNDFAVVIDASFLRHAMNHAGFPVAEVVDVVETNHIAWLDSFTKLFSGFSHDSAESLSSCFAISRAKSRAMPSVIFTGK